MAGFADSTLKTVQTVRGIYFGRSLRFLLSSYLAPTSPTAFSLHMPVVPTERVERLREKVVREGGGARTKDL